MDQFLALYAVRQHDNSGVLLYATIWPSGRQMLVTVNGSSVFGLPVQFIVPSDKVVVTRDTCQDLPLSYGQFKFVDAWLNRHNGKYRATPTRS